MKKTLSSLGSLIPLPVSVPQLALSFCHSEELKRALQECSKASIDCFSFLDGISLLKKTEEETLYLYYEKGKPLEWDQSKFFLLAEAGISLEKVREVVPLLRRMPLLYPDSLPLLTLLRQQGLTPYLCFPCLSPSSYLATSGYTVDGCFLALGQSRKLFALPSLSSIHEAPSFSLVSPSFFPIDFSLLFQPFPEHQAIFTLEDSVWSSAYYQDMLRFSLQGTIAGFVWAEKKWTLIFHDAYPDLLNEKVRAVEERLSFSLCSSVCVPSHFSSPFLLQSTLPLEVIPALFPFPFPASLMVFPLYSFQHASVVAALELEYAESLLAYFRAFSPLTLKLFPTYAHHHR